MVTLYFQRGSIAETENHPLWQRQVSDGHVELV
jgi:hypothetical protein